MDNNDLNIKKEQNNITKEKTQFSNNNSKIIFLILSLVIIGLIAYIVYINFFQRKNVNKSKTNDVQEQKNNISNETNEQNYNINVPTIDTREQESNNSNENDEQNINDDVITKIEGLTYKTPDGKKTLKILNESKYYEELDTQVYHAEYNGKKIKLFVNRKYDKYIEFSGDDIDHFSQCGSYFFIVNIQNNTLIDLDVSKYNYIEQIGNNYYFIQKKFCGGDGFDLYENIYTENMKKIGTAYFGKDVNNNFYVLDNGVVVKYNQNAKELFRSSKKYEQNNIIEMYNSNSCEPVVTNDNLYFGYSGENGIYYLIDIVGNKEIQINKKSDSEYEMDFYGCDFNSKSNDFVFVYELESCGSGCWSDRLTYTYNIKTGNITSKVEKTESTSWH